MPKIPLPSRCFDVQEKSLTTSQLTKIFSTLFLYLTILCCCVQVTWYNLHCFLKENFKVNDVAMRMLMEESLPVS